MIRSFHDAGTRDLYDGRDSREARRTLPLQLTARALRRLDQINRVVKVEELSLPPGNHLEALRGSRRGQWSVRINERWRICFRWENDGAEDVEIVDYH